MTKSKSRKEATEFGVIVGKRARLRPLRLKDRIFSVRWRNDPEIRDNILGFRFPITEIMEAEWISNVLNDQSRTRIVMAIEDRTDGVIVGFVYLSGIDWFSRVAEFGILIGDRSRQGKGLGREALELMATYAFDDLNINKLHLRVASFNRPAQRLYRSFGFVEEGVQREQVFVRGKYRSVLLFGLLRREYRKTV